MKKSVFLDTSYILALINTKDEYHSVALRIANEISDPIITTEAVLTEIGNALAKPQWRQLAVDTLDDLISDPEVEIITISTRLFSKAMDIYSTRMDKEWGLTDCISFVIMEEKKLIRALTTDHHFEQAGFQALLLR